MGKNNYVVTIARGYGSGGKYIANKLAKDLGITILDKDIIRMASLESGISEDLFHNYDENMSKSILEKYKTSVYGGVVLSPDDKKFLSKENLFSIQADMLKRRILGDENFVVLGRAADFVYRNMPNVVSVNIQAPFEDCVESIMTRQNLTARDAIKEIRRIDRCRADYHRHHTGMDWLDYSNYDLCLNSSRIGRDRCVEVIKDYILCKTGIDPRA